MPAGAGTLRLQIYVDEDTAAAIDAARGLATRSTWVKNAISVQLGDDAPVVAERMASEPAPSRQSGPRLAGGGRGRRE